MRTTILSRMTGQSVTLTTQVRLMCCVGMFLTVFYFCFKRGGLDHLLPKFEHIFVAAITFSPFLLCRYF